MSGVSKWDIGGGYKVVLKPSNSKIKLFDGKKNPKYEFEVEKGWKFSVYISGSAVVENGKIDIEVDGVKMLTIPISILNDKDVFSKVDAQRLINEINYIKPFADNEIAPEYDENYCMQAAERGLSELLKNDTDFYAVERGTHQHKNRIGFSGLNAIDRGNRFKANGFVITSWSFDSYTIDHSKRKIINDSKDIQEAQNNYSKVMYDIITITNSNKKTLVDSFKRDINNKIGFHVYYFCIIGGFHTLLLAIDYRNPCDPKYAIYDQHGPTSSHGNLDEIAEGLRRQTSWTFANTCVNRYNKQRTSQWDSTKTTLWKIKRK